MQPDVAVFGEKDFQQLVVIQRLVEDLSLPIEIVSCPTVRADDGLAMSSRNQYLSDEERELAPRLYEKLAEIARELEAGKKDYDALEKSALAELDKLGFRTDYVSIRRAQNLDKPDRDTDELVVLAAAYLGNARLIDNVTVHV